jgi:hypothetical protein
VELGDEQYHAEWIHDDDSGKVTVYILDGKMEKEVPIEASEIEIETKIADKLRSFTLTAVDSGVVEKAAASCFALEDKSLGVALNAAGTEGAEATLKVTVQGKTLTGKFEKHSHDH